MLWQQDLRAMLGDDALAEDRVPISAPRCGAVDVQS
jgi:hypothetical protein